MSIENLKSLYIDQLQDMCSANKQSASLTDKLAKAASNTDLQQALQDGVKGIREGQRQLETLIKAHQADPAGEHCKGMEGLVDEARAHALEEDFGDDETRDAMIITQYQRMVHYAMAGYGCLVAFARRLDLDEQADTLQQCLDSTYGGDRTMTHLATSGINEAAV